ncbi:hypothetical protein L6452_42830 [Arctium lappa]|uniref:Uncharacterized protein n=1 Tax=Arctium lappa TaxID=4217 RepID=A0ACB8XKG8_ARCLA|nr:hypothetical protein L6452_42830 [Arctium lappa]
MKSATPVAMVRHPLNTEVRSCRGKEVVGIDSWGGMWLLVGLRGDAPAEFSDVPGVGVTCVVTGEVTCEEASRGSCSGG